MAKDEDDKLAEVVAQTVAKMLGGASVMNPYPYEVKITVEAT